MIFFGRTLLGEEKDVLATPEAKNIILKQTNLKLSSFVCFFMCFKNRYFKELDFNEFCHGKFFLLSYTFTKYHCMKKAVVKSIIFE